MPSRSEAFRRSVRQSLGYRNPAYQLAGRGAEAFSALRHGTPGLQLLKASRAACGSKVALRLSGLAHPITVRTGTPDAQMVINTVLREEYGQLPDSFRPVTIVDAGAYIGDTAAYFASRFPDATIVALEASGETFEMASFNLSAYGPSVVATHAALWTDDGEVVFGGADTGAHVSSEGTAVPCVSVMSLMTERRWSEIDLLKMDIEGAELPVLLDGASTWLDSIGVLIAELHGTEVEKAVLPLLRAHGFGTYRYRSVWYAVNPGIAQETAWAPFIERW